MKKRKLHYRFHNSNPTAETADYILKIFIEANMGKVERILQKASKEEQSDKKANDLDEPKDVVPSADAQAVYKPAI